METIVQECWEFVLKAMKSKNATGKNATGNNATDNNATSNNATAKQFSFDSPFSTVPIWHQKCGLDPPSIQRSWCVLEVSITNSVTTVPRAFRRIHHVNPPTRKDAFCDQRKGDSGRPLVSEEVVDSVRNTFVRSPGKSTRRASRELQVPQSTVSKILRKRLQFHPYKLPLVQKLQSQDNSQPSAR
ncbi:hypothetical protein GQR58_025569 [Nymphon striatum]|nr:hypothetical protein GQR58_025569 [Nymphon striatum]